MNAAPAFLVTNIDPKHRTVWWPEWGQLFALEPGECIAVSTSEAQRGSVLYTFLEVMFEQHRLRCEPDSVWIPLH
jgi:hypothetical protein